MTTFIAVYRGESVATARLIAVSADPELVSQVVSGILLKRADEDDPVVDTLESGRRGALQLIKRQAYEQTGDRGGRGK